jgi:hypothetical protein
MRMKSRKPDGGTIPHSTATGARGRFTIPPRWRLGGARAALAAAPLLALATVLAFATPAAAQGVIGTGSGRAGAQVAGLVALVGAITGGLALRAAKRARTVGVRDRAIVALVLGAMGVFLGLLHLATTTGGFGTGNGRAGAIVAAVLGSIGVLLGRLALVRCGRIG